VVGTEVNSFAEVILFCFIPVILYKTTKYVYPHCSNPIIHLSYR
jgi:hypothetical protein